ncbi:MAG: hypothetical protein H6839_07765 [Planctomycetes bacterium]|nr:hypothetical protein [Planctomycetota bacterium]
MARWIFVVAALSLCAPLIAQQAPTAAEMAFIYELNRARSDPQQYDTENSLGGILSGVAAQPPLALNLNLVQSSRFHSAEMAANGYFAHQSSVTGDWPNKMADDAGYALPSGWTLTNNYIESIACIFTTGGSISYSPQAALKALIIDAGVPSLGHRKHLLAMDSFNQAFREIGTGYAEGLAPQSGYNAGAYWAIHTGRHDTNPVWLTGVVYSDANSNGRYDQGEGISGVTVSASGPSSVNTVTTTGGGWSLACSAGSWNLTCSGGSFSGTATASVTLTTANVEVDFESGTSAGEVGFGNQQPGPPGGGSGGGGDKDKGGGGGCTAEESGSPGLWLLLAGLVGVLLYRPLRMRKEYGSIRLRHTARPVNWL